MSRLYAFDVDGVILRDDDGADWTLEVERRHGLPLGTIGHRFFVPHWEAVVTGARPLIPALQEALDGTGADAHAVAESWFAAPVSVSPVITGLMDLLRAAGHRVVLATNQEPLRMAHIWERIGLCAHADAFHASAALGAAKPDPAFFAALQAAEGFAPERITFIDDRAENVAAARRLGWQGIHFAGDDAALALSLAP